MINFIQSRFVEFDLEFIAGAITGGAYALAMCVFIGGLL
jgi:hypothetical protein